MATRVASKPKADVHRVAHAGEAPGGDAELIARVLPWNEVFANWPKARLRELEKSARLEHHRRGARVMKKAGRELVLVVSGSVEISRVSGTGHKYVNALLSPGYVAPLISLLGEKRLPAGYDFYAHEDSAVVHLPVPAVLAVLDAQPELWKDVARLALKRQRMSAMLLQAMTLGSMRQRMAAALLSLTAAYGAPQPAGVDLRVRLSQNDIGDLLGLSRQTVSKQLKFLVDAGIIDVAYKRVTVLDVAALTRLAAED